MLSIIRSGSRILRIEGDSRAITDWLRRNFDVKLSREPQIVHELSENDTVIYLTDHGDEVYISVRSFPDVILSKLITDGKSDLVSCVKRLPRMILFRVLENYQSIMEGIVSDFNGRIGSISDFKGWIEPVKGSSCSSESDDEVSICFTSKSLTCPIGFSDLKKEAVFVKMPHEMLRYRLQRRAFYLFNMGMDKSEWRQMEIRIYDSYGRYPLHVERLSKALDYLELGLVLGEGWGKDYAHILMPVSVYCLKILTCFDPKVIKKVLIGLEYIKSGGRFADFDLYYEKKKISWSDVVPSRDISKADFACQMRLYVRDHLAKELLDDLDSMEKSILAQVSDSSSKEESKF